MQLDEVISDLAVMSLISAYIFFGEGLQAMQLYAVRVNLCIFFFCPQDASVVVHNPPNTQSVELYFRGEKMAKVVLRLVPP